MTLAGAIQFMKTQLWEKLGVVFSKYAGSNKNEIQTSKVQQIIHDVLGQQTPQQIDYVIKNMFRLDTDSSGTVSFQQFKGNFLFKRHCGQMSLQKMHMLNQIKHGAQRKIDDQQFYTLINKAYKFLDVSVHHQITSWIFKQSDQDFDGLITYVQYFQIIDHYICKSTTKPLKPSKPIQINSKQRNSRLRSYIWVQLRKLYQSYIHGRYLVASDRQLKGLILNIVGDLSQSQMSFMLTDLFRLNMRFIQFQPFASHFLYLIAQLRLSRYSRYNNLTKKTLSKNQFFVLLKNTYQFLSLGRVRMSYLQKLYNVIDQNKDGIVSYEEYLDWVKRFLSVIKYQGVQFYFVEDDLDVQNTQDQLFQPDRQPVQNKKIAQNIRFTFKDLGLAYQVRERMFSLLIEFDANHDHLFDQLEINNALTVLLKQDPIELKYVTLNVFRYDRDGDKNVTYDQFTNFCVEQHFGQMAIQRLHRKNYYSRGKQRIMNIQQFGKTLNYSLQFIHLEASQYLIKTLFNQIDLDHDGWISYEIYFFFLKYYFGSLSQAAKKPNIKIQHKTGTLEKDVNMLNILYKLGVLDRFVKLIMDQLKEICKHYDFNHNMVYQPEEIQAILTEVFQLSPAQISYIMYNFFRFDIRSEKTATYEEFIAIVLQTYFVQILFKRKYHSQNSQIWIHNRISIRQFIDFLHEPCFFIRVKPSKQDLLTIFQILDRDKDGFISFEQYINFIRKYLGRGLAIIDLPIRQIPLKDKPVIQGISNQEYQFVQTIWGQLKIYFDKYDSEHKGFLKQSQLKSFAVDVLHETSQRELDYIFWNLFRVDSNYNREVSFQQFAPFILNHAGQISLQRFHRQQIKGKSSLTQDQLYSVLNGAYNFLTSIPKSKVAISSIFNRINNNGLASYGNFLQWVQTALAKRFR